MGARRHMRCYAPENVRVLPANFSSSAKQQNHAVELAVAGNLPQRKVGVVVLRLQPAVTEPMRLYLHRNE